MAIFFQANAYFQIKSDEDMTQPDSPEFQELEKLETEGYDKAKRLRREILQEVGMCVPYTWLKR
jgi:E3 ubiquitin-protein ligase SHPRH